MAVPLIVGVAAGAVGLYKAGKAISDNSEAKELNENARDIVSSAQNAIDNARKDCNKTLERLGQSKIDAIIVNVRDFLKVFTQIKNVEFSNKNELEELNLKDFSQDVLQEMTHEVSLLSSAGVGLAGGSAGGALAAFGAYNGTMLLASASTGTAISSLSGAAATNATLAWLGGGSIASGGLGIAGGTIALGSLVAGPALLISGWYMGSKAEKNLNDAKSNLEQARTFKEDMQAAENMTNGIREVAEIAFEVLSVLRKTTRRSIRKLNDIIIIQGTNYQDFTDEAKELTFKTFKTVQLLNALIDTPILDKNGELLGDAESNIRKISVQLA